MVTATVRDKIMKRIILFCFTVAVAGCVSAKDLRVENIPSDKIKKALPKEWRLASVTPADTVSGWEKLSGSKGVCITISRTPYDDTLHRTKSGALAIHIPKFYLYVFPSDFVGRHANGAGVFKDGKIAKAKSPLLTDRAILIMETFTPVGDWYVFHNNPSFQDWKTPIVDVIKTMK